MVFDIGDDPLLNVHDDIPVIDYGDVYFLYDDPVIGPILPLLFITIPVRDGDGAVGRDRIDCYPYAETVEIDPVGIGHADDAADVGVPFYDAGTAEDDLCHVADESDPEGRLALQYGGMYYEEGMGYTAPEDRRARIDCFKAAEILYRHAAGRGNAIGWLCLGYVYAYDRCEGEYYRSYFDNFGEVPPKPDADTLAFECFRHAADRRLAEGCYKLGDMLTEGRGCEVDYAAALDMFLKAYRYGRDGSPRIWGSVALRLARAYANARGCVLDYDRALHWYGVARTGLELEVRDGGAAYDARLWEAEAGVRDMRQALRLMAR
ncbi:tetratricopeptide repeat protein [Bifidobacterium parmae]|uniref:Sel1 repeat protein n=1 Tax=Bifidobacterium parmae TaxID=361854 RepID=A0A2N5IYW7_9BIFI|nr:hypothetical protein [Bifidobacterium parmae]PLS27161.1 Sel1 repeat protein [Bifidobacterium parmae]